MENHPSSVPARSSSSSSSINQELANKERQEVAADDVIIKIPSRRMHRVPSHMRENKKHIYDPVIISIGPYHHRKPHLDQAEKLKDDILNKTFASPEDKDLFRRQIRERLDDIRSQYEELDELYTTNDDAIVDLMVRDACFILSYMKMATGEIEDGVHLRHRLGLSRGVFMIRDVIMIENQIPFWIIKQLVGLIYDKEEGKALFCKYLSLRFFGDLMLSQLPWEDEEQEPLHLLEAERMTLLKGFVQPSLSRSMRRRLISHCGFKLMSHPFRSVRDLKAKGIYFSSSSNCLMDFRFNSHSFYGKLQIPIWFVSNLTPVFFSNVIAFEMSPETDTNGAVISYVNFMKSLIDNTKDVKELREKEILFSSLVNDEEVVKVFKEIETYGVDMETFFDVKMRIEEHCDSKLMTWMGELIHTYFHSPWTAIALFAATFLLSLTFLQSFFTIRPPKKD